MASFFQVPDARRIRSFFTKLPLATRLLLLLFTAFWIAKVVSPGLEQWGALIPQEINFGTREFTLDRKARMQLTIILLSLPSEHLPSTA